MDVYFDSTDEALAIAGTDGSFSGIEVKVPASALPGAHFISAVSLAHRAGAQDTFTVRANWPQFHDSPRHKGVNPDENVLSAANVSGLGLDWSFTTGDSIENSSPAVVDGIVYEGSRDGRVYALDAATGAKKWSFAAGDAVESSPAVAGGVVYVGSEDGSVYAWTPLPGPSCGASPPETSSARAQR